MQEYNSVVCMDNAAIHEAMGNAYLIICNIEQAAISHQKHLAIYPALFPDQSDVGANLPVC